jgi:hypothetical protein
MQASMFGVAAFIQHLEVSFVVAADAHQYIRLVVFTEVTTETALSAIDCFHVLPPLHGLVGDDTALHDYSSPAFVLCKLRPYWSTSSIALW